MICGFSEKLLSFDTTTNRIDLNLFDNSDSSIGNLQDNTKVWLFWTVKNQKMQYQILK